MANQKNSGNDRKTIDVNRSSETGRFVTERYAERHPRTTEHERIRKPNR